MMQGKRKEGDKSVRYLLRGKNIILERGGGGKNIILGENINPYHAVSVNLWEAFVMNIREHVN